jgi:hypothetical protein
MPPPPTGRQKPNEFLELFIFSLPKARYFSFFYRKISLTSSVLKEWEGTVGWNIKA